MKLIIGLGNPGEKYEKTRHNTGWMVLDKLAGEDKWQENKKAKLLYLKMELNNTATELIKPLTFMNNSGEATAYAVKNHRVKPEDIFVVYDDLDLPAGKIRIGKFDSAGGHKGVESIIKHLKNKNFIRIRIGINPEKQTADLSAEARPARRAKAEKLVLQKFGLTEKKKVNQAIEQAAEAINMLLASPLEKVMNKYN